MYPANITRAEAAERSAQVSTHSYDVLVDLSGRVPDAGEFDPTATFVSTSTVRFTTVGGATYVNLIADRLLVATLDGAPLADDAFADHKVHFTAEAGDHELVITALCRYSRTGEGLHRFVDPVDDLVYCYTQLETADSRRLYACFEQPDLKATFALTVIAPDAWTVLSNSPAVEPAPLGDGLARWEFAATPPISTYITALDRRLLPRRHRHAHRQGRRDPAVGGLPPVAGALPRRRPDPRHDQGRLRRVRGALRHAVPVRRLRAGVRAGVQRRRHGERRLRHDPRRVPLPLPRHPGLLRDQGQHDPARARPHVVRRPGHHDLVGRPVAQRVVRRMGVPLLPGRDPGQRRAPATTRGPPSPTAARTGPTGRTSCPPPTRWPPTWSTWKRSS